ncbi:guanine nucleotide-binding protein subunit gamma 2-like [Olea europaea var. sylvestris]|nr:guanine nucleotide-binding protein subunit gamma 2-like [Olea europaea var. sylvestris]CAA3028060.1 guanine nucleotide-binding subunit gamma 2-like [Olea europaea subsp. europaea]
MESAPPKATEPPHQHAPSSSSSSSLALSLEGSVSNNNVHETRSSPFAGNSTTGLMGKHRMSAAISFLNQQIQSIQEELGQLETLGRSSAVCEELILSVESVPDALLPATRGPTEVSWERWFQGAHGSGNRRRRWI